MDEARVRASNLSVIAAGSKPVPPAPPGTPGLGGVDRWLFDEASGTTAKDSVGDQDLTLRGGATFAPGLAGNALALNGNGQFAESAGTPIPTENTDYSVSAWVKLNAVGGAFQTVVSEDGDANSAFFLQFSGADQRWAFSFANVRAVATAVGVPVAGRWYHLVGVRDVSNSKLSIYVDGAPSGSVGILGGGDKGTGSLEIGRGKFGGNPVDYLNGMVDDAKLFDRALSADDVKALDSAGPTK